MAPVVGALSCTPRGHRFDPSQGASGEVFLKGNTLRDLIDMKSLHWTDPWKQKAGQWPSRARLGGTEGPGVLFRVTKSRQMAAQRCEGTKGREWQPRVSCVPPGLRQ